MDRKLGDHPVALTRRAKSYRATRVIGRPAGRPYKSITLDDGDFGWGEVVELVDEFVNLMVGGLDLAREAFFFVGQAVRTVGKGKTHSTVFQLLALGNSWCYGNQVGWL